MSSRLFGPAAVCLCIGSSLAADGLRVAAWNISNYNGGNAANIATAVYGQFNGRQFAPDVILLQEIRNQSALNSMVSALNNAAGSPGDWAGGTFYGGGGGGLNTALVYRQDKLDQIGSVLVWPGSSSTNPRNIVRYDMRLDGYTSDEAVFSCYPVHMKAGSGSSDQNRRLIEGQRIRDDAESLPAGRHFILGGDTNTQSSNQAGYQELVGSQANNAGRFFDPINTPGTWNNSFTYRFIHTQDPVGGGGMDDRHDQLLISANLGDGVGLDYIGNFAQPWDLSTWDDPDHSYRCWGNDGSSFNQALRTTGNVAVGSAIAQSLILLGDNSGHLPVYLDLSVPAKAGADLAIDFGTVNIGDTAQMPLDVFNAGDVTLWGAGGIEDLDYTLTAPAGFTVAPGPFTEAAGGGVNTHTVTMITSAAGVFSGTLVIESNDPDSPVLTVSLTGEVAGAACAADLAEPFGVLDLADINAFTQGFLNNDPIADIATPFGVFDLNDINLFVELFVAGCE